MVKVTPIRTFAELASSKGQQHAKITKGKDTLANVLFNENTFDVYFMNSEERAVSGIMSRGDKNEIKKAIDNFLRYFKNMENVEGLDIFKNLLKQ